jgi:hypothetical protein
MTTPAAPSDMDEMIVIDARGGGFNVVRSGTQTINDGDVSGASFVGIQPFGAVKLKYRAAINVWTMIWSTLNKITQDMFGQVNNGVAVAGGSGNWTVVRNSVGNYTITWGNTYASNAYGFVAMGIGPLTAQMVAATKAAGSVGVQLVNASGVLTDGNFLFMAKGY